MFTVKASQRIARAPGDVFEFAGDYANDPLWRKGVVSMAYEPSGPPSVGVRIREVMRSLGRNFVTLGEITEFSPTRTAFRSLSGPVSCRGSRDFAASGGGTQFTYSLTLCPTGVLRLLEPLLRSMFAKQVQGDVAKLTQLLEAPARQRP